MKIVERTRCRFNGQNPTGCGEETRHEYCEEADIGSNVNRVSVEIDSALHDFDELGLVLSADHDASKDVRMAIDLK